MLLEFYFLLFFLTALTYIYLKTKSENYTPGFDKLNLFIKYKDVLMLLKSLPLILAIIFSFLLKKTSSDVYTGIFFALLFCFLGDYFIDRNLIQGMLFFAMAHIFLIISFVYSTLLHLVILQTYDYLLLITLTVLILVYDYTFVRYLMMIKIPEKYNLPIAFYSLLISMMFASTIWLTYISGIGELIILPIGAFSFMISDTIIAIREFRPKQISNSVVKIMGPYYLAIFLLSLATMYI